MDHSPTAPSAVRAPLSVLRYQQVPAHAHHQRSALARELTALANADRGHLTALKESPDLCQG